LVATVKGVAEFEKETYTAVAEARSRASQVSVTPGILDDPGRLRQFQEAQGEVSSALSRLLVTVEKYPDLKANQSFLELQSQLESTENRIAVERRRFNDSVVAYNNAVRVFPARILAGMFGFSRRELFEAEAGSEEAPKVAF
jgi:LemA protein